jgi:hypothetical protein
LAFSLCMIFGKARPDGRRLVVAKTEAGVRRWAELSRECAQAFEVFPVLDVAPNGVRMFDAPHRLEPHYRGVGG